MKAGYFNQVLRLPRPWPMIQPMPLMIERVIQDTRFRIGDT